MTAAARVGDMTSHGTPLGPGPGSANVLIGGMPAWRAMMDTHVCPVSTPNPHGSGMTVTGSFTVLINGSWAARQGDTILEAGPPNAITVGCANVQIGG